MIWNTKRELQARVRSFKKTFKKIQFFNYKNCFDKVGYDFLLKEEYLWKVYLKIF